MKHIPFLISELNGYSKLKSDDESFVFTNNRLTVGIFRPGHYHGGEKGCVRAEHTENFNKWQQCFYSAPLPQNKSQALAILADLCYVDSPENKKLGRVFGTLTRDF